MMDVAVKENPAATSPVHWDPYNQRYFMNPYPVFQRLREEAPIYYNDEFDFYAVSRYDDCVRVLGDREEFISSKGGVLEHMKSSVPIPSGMFIYEDPPLHTFHRGLLTRVFTPRRVRMLEKEIREFCARALDPLVGTGRFDFIEHLGSEMPMRVIGMLLGMPEEDLKEAQRRVDDNMRTVPGQPLESSGKGFSGEAYAEYVDWRIKNPSDDLISDLLGAEYKDDTGALKKLTRDEVLTFISLIFGAGNETTNRLIGWTGKLLAEHPDQRRQINADRSLISQAIEEILRYESPGPYVGRTAARDAEFHGVTVPAGKPVLAVVAAGNRDERKFADGETFNIHRKREPHLTFGFGFHACLGNPLARIEGRIALEELLNRFPEWDVDMANAKMSSTSTVRGWESLPAFVPA
jgi:cytochrome P450